VRARPGADGDQEEQGLPFIFTPILTDFLSFSFSSSSHRYDIEEECFLSFSFSSSSHRYDIEEECFLSFSFSSSSHRYDIKEEC
jgi:hypothetical protein